MKWSPLLLAVAALSGCRDVPDDDRPGSTNRPDAGGALGPDGSMAVAGTVRSLRQSPPAKNAPVTLQGVVVVGRVTSSRNAYAWVQDPGGGPLSGISIYCQKENGCAAGYDVIDKLEDGDVVDIAGKYDEFMGTAQLIAPTVTKKGTKIAPVALTITADQVANTVAIDGAFDQIHQALVRLEGPIKVSNVTPAGLARDCPTGSGKQYDGFEVTAGGKTVNVGLGFYDTVKWCIPGCGFTCDKPVPMGMDLQHVQGVIRVMNGIVRVDPVWESNLLGAGQLPPDGGVPPDGGGGMNHDGGGGGDPDGGGPITLDGTVQSVTRSLPPDNTVVTLKEVVIVGVETSATTAQAYVQDKGGGEYSGILLYCGSACRAGLATLQPGDVIDATGKFKHFSGNTPELVEVEVTAHGTTAAVVPLQVHASSVATTVNPSSPAFRPYNGVLVELTGPITVTSTDVLATQSSNTCTGGNRYREGFEAGAGATRLYVGFFFADNISSCLAGGCRTCDVGPITTAHRLNFLRGVARAHKGAGDTVVTIAPVDEIDMPRTRSIRALHAQQPSDGQTVTVEQAVVVGYNSVSSTRGSLFLQDQGGGRWSGLQLFCTAAACNDVAKVLAPGDLINVTGKYLLYQGNTPEIDAAVAPVKTGSTRPVATTPPPGALDMSLPAYAAEFQPYNQAYVRIAGPISVANLTPEDLTLSCGPAALPRFEGFQVSDGAHEYLVADLFAPTYTYCVEGGCDPCTNAVGLGDRWSRVSGIARIGRASRIQLAPTADSDVVPATE
jgi:hypothetical protein